MKSHPDAERFTLSITFLRADGSVGEFTKFVTPAEADLMILAILAQGKITKIENKKTSKKSDSVAIFFKHSVSSPRTRTSIPPPLHTRA